MPYSSLLFWTLFVIFLKNKFLIEMISYLRARACTHTHAPTYSNPSYPDEWDQYLDHNKGFHRNKNCPRPGIRGGIVILFLLFAQLPPGHVKLSKWHNHSWTSVELQLPRLLSKISLWGSGCTILCSKHDPLQQLDKQIWLELPPSINYLLSQRFINKKYNSSFFFFNLFIHLLLLKYG